VKKKRRSAMRSKGCEPGGYDVSTGSPYFKYFAISNLLLSLILFLFKLLFPSGNYIGKESWIFSLKFIHDFGHPNGALLMVQKSGKSEKK
jgi:hypothetical protein